MFCCRFRYGESELPKDDSGIKNWLADVWKNKERRLNRFYSTGSFTNHDYTPDCLEQNNTNELLKKRANAEGKFAEFKSEQANDFLSNNIPSKDFKAFDVRKYHPSNNLYLALIFWTNLVLFFFYCFVSCGYFRIWVGFHFCLFIGVSYFSAGFHQILANVTRGGGGLKCSR